MYLSETPTERLRRLRFEIEELETQLVKQNDKQDSLLQDTKDESEYEEELLSRRDDADKTRPTRRSKKHKVDVDKDGELSPAILIAQLSRMKYNLGRLGVGMEKSDCIGDGASLQRMHEQVGTKDLLEKLKRPEHAEPPSSLASDADAGSPKFDLSDASASRMDERLETLEKYIGANEREVDEVLTSILMKACIEFFWFNGLSTAFQTHPLPPPLLSSISKLEHQLQLLTQPRHLETVSRRVKVLVTDLERVHEARRKIGDTRPLNLALSSGISISTGLSESIVATGTSGEQLPADALQKIDGLFTLLPRIDPLIPLTPHILNRLRSLSTLHSSSSTFSQDLQGVEQSVESLKHSENFLQQLLAGLEDSLTTNQEVMSGNLESLQRRVDEVMKRLEMLKL